MIFSGDIVPRRDTDQELYVVVLSNTIHLAAATGRVITCPFIPGEIPSDTMAMIVAVQQPKGVIIPELVQCLPIAALGERISTIDHAVLADTTTIVTAFIS